MSDTKKPTVSMTQAELDEWQSGRVLETIKQLQAENERLLEARTVAQAAIKPAEKQAQAEVLAAVYDQWAQVSQVIISRIGNAIDLLNDGQIGKARNELIIAEGSIDECAKRMRTVQPAAKDLEEFEERVQQESYGAARILWVAGICDLLKIPKPKADESGLGWLLREGNRALEELLREAELKGVKFAQYETVSCISARIAELEKARAVEKQARP